MASITAPPRADHKRASSPRAKSSAKSSANSSGGFHQSWYAIARSAEIGVGEVIGRDFLSGRAVVYRGDGGQPSVMNAYCRHLGADLSMGKVIGDDIQCAFHHWQYGPDGGCTKNSGLRQNPESGASVQIPHRRKVGADLGFQRDQAALRGARICRLRRAGPRYQDG